MCASGVVVRSKSITLWSDPVVASSSTALLVMDSVVVGVCKGEVKDGGACSISVVVGGGVVFVKELEVVGVCTVDDCRCTFRCFDCRVPPLVMGIEVSSNDGMLG